MYLCSALHNTHGFNHDANVLQFPNVFVNSRIYQIGTGREHLIAKIHAIKYSDLL